MALDVAANQEIGRRHLVASRALVQVGAGAGIRDAAFRTADRVVAFAERRGAVVAVGRDLRHRQRLRPLAVSAAICAASVFFRARVLGGQDAIDLRARRR